MIVLNNKQLTDLRWDFINLLTSIVDERKRLIAIQTTNAEKSSKNLSLLFDQVAGVIDTIDLLISLECDD